MSEFDVHDPELKAAIRRAWASECCPLALRKRLSDLTQVQPSPDVAGRIRPDESRRPVVDWHYRIWLGTAAAAAAVLLGVIGITQFADRGPVIADGGITISNPVDYHPAMPVQRMSSLSSPVVDSLVSIHDRCSRISDHHHLDGVDHDDFSSIALRLQGQLNRPVLAVPLGDQWHFQGAAICPVGKSDAAHLVYISNGRSISVFSLPASACEARIAGAWDIEAKRADHRIAGFIRDDGFYCVVGSSDDGSITSASVRAVREQLRHQLPAKANSVTFPNPDDHGLTIIRKSK